MLGGVPKRFIQKVEPFVEPVYIETRKSYKDTKDIFMMRLNRPHANNTIDTFLAEHLVIALKSFQQNTKANSAIMFGAGESFSGGCDLSHFNRLNKPSQQIDRILAGFNEQLPKSVSCEKPIIAAIDGMCLNGGLELALNADYIVATDQARFNLLQFQIGFPLVDNGSMIIPKIIGLEKTLELIETGRVFSAQEAFEMGLVNKVVTQKELQPAAYETAKHMTQDPSFKPLNQSSVFRTFYGDQTKQFALENVFIQP